MLFTFTKQLHINTQPKKNKPYENQKTNRTGIRTFGNNHGDGSVFGSYQGYEFSDGHCSGVVYFWLVLLLGTG